MYHPSFSRLLVRPSFSSSVVCAILAVAVPAAVNWPAELYKLPFHEDLFGPNGLAIILRNSNGSTSAVGQVLTSPALAHNTSIFLGAMLAGIVLYAILRLVVMLMSSISMTIKEIQAVETPAKHAVERELERRVGVRLLIVLVWIVYTYLFVRVILPFCVLASQLGLSDTSKTAEGVGYVLFAITMSFFAFHAHVIAARLFLLRPRVFGVKEVLLTD